MEGTHRQLCTGLTDRLRCNNTNCFTNLYRFAGRHVRAVALCTDTALGTTGQDGTDLHFLHRLALLIDTCFHNPFCTAGCDHVVCTDDQLAVLIINVFTGIASCNSVF